MIRNLDPIVFSRRTNRRGPGVEIWANAGRAIAAEYGSRGNPLRALEALGRPPPMLHLFSQPRAEAFLDAHLAYASAQPRFRVERLDATAHFPALEIRGATAQRIEAFVVTI